MMYGKVRVNEFASAHDYQLQNRINKMDWYTTPQGSEYWFNCYQDNNCCPRDMQYLEGFERHFAL